MSQSDETEQQDNKSSSVENACPVCGAKLISESCKVVCRSQTCVYRIVFNCSEF